MSTSPSSPNAAIGSPVWAASAIRRRSAVKNRRGAMVASPGQYATPRRDGAPVFRTYRQIAMPVSAWTAATWLEAATYITPLTTIGVNSDPPDSVPAVASRPSGYDQARLNLATLPVLICLSGEYRVPPRSRLYIGQSAAGAAARSDCACATAMAS